MNGIDKTNSVLDSLGLSQQKPKPEEAKLGQDQFLQLMIAQLNSQDPFQPMESGEFLTQIAQFTQASGIQDLQNSFNQLSSSLTSNQALQASSLVGRNVLVESNVGVLPPEGSLRGAIDLSQPAQSVHVDIYSASGELVRRMELGAQNSGRINFGWDGLDQNGARLQPGQYTLKAEAASNGQVGAATMLMGAAVESVTLGGAGQGLTLNLAGLGKVGFGDVKEIM